MDINVTELVDTYLSMWNETDRARRAAHIERAWAPACRYVDPMLDAEGHEGLEAIVTGVQKQYPSHTFRRTSAVDQHHDQIRFGWELTGPDGKVLVAGIDVGELHQGKLRRITGFFGPLPDRG